MDLVWLRKNKSILLGIIPLLASLLFIRTDGLVHKVFTDPKLESDYQELYKPNENPDTFSLGFVDMCFFVLSVILLGVKTLLGNRYPYFVGDIIFATLSFFAFDTLDEISRSSDIGKTLFENGDWTPVTNIPRTHAFIFGFSPTNGAQRLSSILT